MLSYRKEIEREIQTDRQTNVKTAHASYATAFDLPVKKYGN